MLSLSLFLLFMILAAALRVSKGVKKVYLTICATERWVFSCCELPAVLRKRLSGANRLSQMSFICQV